MNDQRLKNILESRPPRLSDEAARRIDARVAERVRRRPGRPFRAWAMALAPALLLLLALIWLLPRGREESRPFLVDENQFVAYLGQLDGTGTDLNEILQLDYDLDGNSWTLDEKKAFLKELENFSLDTI